MSSIIEVSAPKVNREVQFEKEFGANTVEKVEMFTEEVCDSSLNAMFVIKAQAAVRARLVAVNEDGTPTFTDEQAIEAGLSYIPQKAARGKKKDVITVLAEKVAKGELSKKDLMLAIEAKVREIQES